jgi:hypothetical protein
MGITSNGDKKSFPAWQNRRIVLLLAHDPALRQCWRNAGGKERDAWWQGIPPGMLVRKNG